MTDKLTGHAVRLAKRLNKENEKLTQRINKLEREVRMLEMCVSARDTEIKYLRREEQCLRKCYEEERNAVVHF